jgi:hypothetical protein
VAAGHGGAIVTSTDLSTWATRTSGTAQIFYEANFLNNLFIALGDGGAIVTSTDAITWTPASGVPSLNYRSAAYSAGVYVVYAQGVATLTSTDAVTWATTFAWGGSSYGDTKISYAGGQFLTHGNQDFSLTSTDGYNWVVKLSNFDQAGTVGNINDFQYAGDRFIASQTAGQILTSTDGAEWITQVTTGVGGIACAGSINGGYAFISSDLNACGFSVDGTKWVPYTASSSFSGTSGNITSLLYAPGQANRFMYGTSAGLAAATSPFIWTQTVTTGTTQEVNSLAYGDGAYVSGGFNSTAPRGSLVSNDGVSWRGPSSYWTSSNVPIVAYGSARIAGPKFITLPQNGTGIGVSTSGGVFQQLTTSFASFSDCTYGDNQWLMAIGASVVYVQNTLQYGRNTVGQINVPFSVSCIGFAGNSQTGRWFAGGTGGEIATVVNGLLSGSASWTTRTSPTTSNLRVAEYLNNTYMLAGGGGALVTSTDGITWANRTSGTASTISSLAFGNGRYVYKAGNIGSNSNLVGTSTDAITWTTTTIGVATSGSLLYAEGLFRIVFAGSQLTSTDGLTWIAPSQFNTSITNVTALSYSNNRYLAGNSSGTIATSSNGSTWTTATSGLSGVLSFTYSPAYGLYYAIGANGVSTSTDSITWSPQVTNGASQTTQNITALTYANGQFVYGGAGGAIGTSTDGFAWTVRRATGTGIVNFAQMPGLLIGGGTALQTSTDGITWGVGSPLLASIPSGRVAYGTSDGVLIYGGASGAGGAVGANA